MPSLCVNGMTFGSALALSGDGKTLVVGDPTTTKGTAYVFTKVAVDLWGTNNHPDTTLTPFSSGNGDSVGTSVALNTTGSTIVVGAPDSVAAAGYTWSGAVYTFEQHSVNLSNLVLTTATLNPSFTTNTLVYTATVANNVLSITVTPTVTDPTSTVKVNNVAVASGSASGAIDLTVGDNTITVVVTALDHTTTKTYRITVRRRSANANLSNLTLNGWTFSPNFSPPTVTYAATVANNVLAIGVTPTVTDTTATINVNNSKVASGSSSNAIGLAVGDNTVTVVVTAEDGNTKTYTVTVTRTAGSSSANLSGLTLNGGTLSPGFAAGTTSYTAIVANSVTSVTVTPTVTDTTTTIKVNGTTVASGSASGSINLTVGPNVITILVTASDNSTNTYTITVTRTAGSSSANLSGLTLSGGTLSPSFAAGTTSYTVAVANSVSSVTVTPTVTDTTTTIKVNGTTVASGSASGSINLTVGPNVITILVTASDNSTNTYTITVTRTAGSSSANLSGLTLSGGTLNPSFAADTTSYTVAVSNTVNSITVTPTVTDPTTVTIKVNGMTVASGSASGAINLTVGLNLITVVVTASDGSTQTYTIAVTRAGTAAIAVTQTYTPTALITTSNAITLTIVIGSTGPDAVTGVVVTDNFPPAVSGTSWTWTCVGRGGAICGTASGTGNLNLLLGLLPKDGSFTFIVTGTLSNPRNWSNWFIVTTPTGVVNTTTGNQSTIVGRAQMYLPLVQRSGSTRIYLPLVFPPLP